MRCKDNSKATHERNGSLSLPPLPASTAQVPQQLVDGPYLELLSREERAYVEAGRGPALRRERLLSRVLLRTTLAAYCCGSVGSPAALRAASAHRSCSITAVLQPSIWVACIGDPLQFQPEARN